MGVTINGRGKDDLIISAAFVQSLRDTRARLQREIEERHKELTGVMRQIEAVETLAPHLVTQKQPEQEPIPQLVSEDEPLGSVSLVEAVTKAVREAGRSLTPSQIRTQVERQGDGHLLTSQNYLYTAIKRVVERGTIYRARDGSYRLSPTNSPQRENPEAFTPGS